MKIAVIGAGITGITTAYSLVKRGYDVEVYEQDSYPAMRTSFANGGQISVSNSETWTSWSNIIKAVKWLTKKDAPLLIRPDFDLAKFKWMSRFLWTTIAGDGGRNTINTIKMGLRSRVLYEEIIDKEKIEFDRLKSGIVHFYKDPVYWSHAMMIQEMYQGNGCEWDLLSGDEVKKLDPALKDINGIIGGTWTKSDWTGDIHKFCYEMEKVLVDKGVKFCYNTTISDVKDIVDMYDAVIIANGVGSTKLAKKLGEDIGVYPVKGYSITINNVDPEHLPRVSLLDDQAKIVTASLGNRFRVAGTAELCGENYDIRRDRIEPLLNWVKENFPAINRHDYTQWACLRPMTPNMMPVIRQSAKHNKVFYNTGHGHLGWTLGPETAEMVADVVDRAFR